MKCQLWSKSSRPPISLSMPDRIAVIVKGYPRHALRSEIGSHQASALIHYDIFVAGVRWSLNFVCFEKFPVLLRIPTAEDVVTYIDSCRKEDI